MQNRLNISWEMAFKWLHDQRMIPIDNIPLDLEELINKFPKEFSELEIIIEQMELLNTGKIQGDRVIVEKIITQETITLKEHNHAINGIQQEINLLKFKHAEEIKDMESQIDRLTKQIRLIDPSDKYGCFK